MMSSTLLGGAIDLNLGAEPCLKRAVTETTIALHACNAP